MVRNVLVLALASLIIHPAIAQDRVYPQQRPGAGKAAVADERGIVHISDVLNSTPEALSALEEFRSRKRLGLLPRHQVIVPAKTGSMATFRVLNLATNEWSDAQFELKGQASGGSIECTDESGTRSFQNAANIWVEVGESSQGNGHVSDAAAQSIADALVLTTPPGSVNADAGSITNNTRIFGCPPDIDGDGTLDVLVYDIIDDQEGGFVAGFVSSQDLTSTGNSRDVLHLDSNEGIYQRANILDALGTAAHEYQHLVHFNFSSSEISFVNEGLSEWAEVLNGYPTRTMSYLTSESEINIGLWTWRGGEAGVLNDYQRAGLFMSYLAHRLGAELIGSMTREPSSGLAGMQKVLDQAGLLVQDAVVDFHTATLLNTTGLTSDPRYALHPGHTGVSATVSGTRIANGRFSESASFTETVIEGGAVYRVWTNVRDLVLDAVEETGGGGGGGGGPEKRNESARFRAAVESGGAFEIVDLDPSLSPFTFNGPIDRLSLVVANRNVQEHFYTEREFTYRFSSTWTGTGATTQEVKYDNGRVAIDPGDPTDPDDDSSIYLLVCGDQPISLGGRQTCEPGSSQTRGFGTKFTVPAHERASIDFLYVPVYYLSQFGGTDVPDSAPRNFRLALSTVDQATGGPGAEFFSKEFTDTRAYRGVFVGDPLRFLKVELGADAPTIGALPPDIFISLSNVGTDSNYLIFAVSDYTVENVSYVTQDGTNWGALWSVTLTGPPEFALDQHVIGIRATFLVQPEAVAIEDAAEVPEDIRLDQNYPNPFNPTTAIRFDLPQAGEVELAVHDILGRRVATLVQGLQTAGTYEITVDASGWASGLYVYSLRTESRTITRNMVLLK